MDYLILAYVVGFLISFYLVIKSADYAIDFATALARIVGLSEFVISFFLIGFVSALPEGVIAMSAAFQGKAGLAATALLASDVGDILFVFGIIAVFASGLRITSPVLKRETSYLVLLALPLLLGFDGTISRAEGLVLLIGGLVYMLTLAHEHAVFKARVHRDHFMHATRTTVLLIVSLLVMGVAANFTVSFMSLIASSLGVSTTLIAVFVIGIGTCLPELLFTLRTLKQQRHDMALGNILGVVIIDATIMLGLAAMVRPLVLGQAAMQTLGFFAVLGGVVLFYFLKVHKKLTAGEGLVLLGIYGVFALTQIVLH